MSRNHLTVSAQSTNIKLEDPDDNANRCQICLKIFANSIDFYKHFETHFMVQTQPTDLTKGSKPQTNPFDQLLLGSLHPPEKRRKSEIIYQCTECQEEFRDSSLLSRHMVVHWGSKPYKCHLCSEAFSNAATLHTHLRKHREDECHKCAVCQKAFKDPEEFKSHISTHTDSSKPDAPYVRPLPSGQKPYSCQVCQTSFEHNAQLDSHVASHSAKDFICSMCGTNCETYFAFKTHIASHTNLRYKCPHCHMSFKNMASYTPHVRRHTGERPFKCELCSKGFVKSWDLKLHMYTHTGEKPHKCVVCGKGFTQVNNFKRHTCKPKPTPKVNLYDCELCGESMASSVILSQHLKKHSKEVLGTDHSNKHMNKHFEEMGDRNLSSEMSQQVMPLRCGEASLVDSSHLTYPPLDLSLPVKNEHTEETETQFYCQICGDSFQQVSALEEHKETHEEVGGNLCLVCGKSFRLSSDLEKHVSKHSGDNNEMRFQDETDPVSTHDTKVLRIRDHYQSPCQFSTYKNGPY